MPDHASTRTGYGTPCPHEDGSALAAASHFTHVTARQWAAARTSARRDGRSAGHAAGTWVFDGNTDTATYRATRKGINAGDPEVIDPLYSRIPNLSGEMAGEPTPHSVLTDAGLDLYVAEFVFDDILQVWESACDAAFWQEVSRTITAQLGPERIPVMPELFARTAPAFNCISDPEDGPHYISPAGVCQWCGEDTAKK